MNGILTVRQIANKLQVNKETVYRWLRTGKLAGSKLGNKLWRITDEQLASFLQRRTGAESEHGRHTKNNKSGCSELVAGSAPDPLTK